MKLFAVLALAAMTAGSILTVSNIAHAGIPEIEARGGETPEARTEREAREREEREAARGDQKTVLANSNARTSGEAAALEIAAKLKSKQFDACTGSCRETLETIVDTVMNPKAHGLSGQSAEEAALLAMDVNTALNAALRKGGGTFDPQHIEDEAIRQRLGIDEKTYKDACSKG
jgi:hypothetical protein